MNYDIFGPLLVFQVREFLRFTVYSKVRFCSLCQSPFAQQPTISIDFNEISEFWAISKFRYFLFFFGSNDEISIFVIVVS